MIDGAERALTLAQMGFRIGLVSAVPAFQKWSTVREEHSRRGGFGNIQEHCGTYPCVSNSPKNPLA